jgi:hypothetical protein
MPENHQQQHYIGKTSRVFALLFKFSFDDGARLGHSPYQVLTF